MINLTLQIKTLLFSFCFGIFFAIMVNINLKFILSSNKFTKLIFTFLFVTINVLIYFIAIKKINDAYIHPYFILMIIVGYIVEIFIQKLIVKMLPKWYNVLRIGGSHEKKKKSIK